MVDDQRDGYLVSNNRARLNIELIHEFLCKSGYWALGRPLAVVQRSIEESLCFGVYQGAHSRWIMPAS